jgi:glycosyltransferase involved in cell wall biosynthesis
MEPKKKITILVPVYNEEASIGRLYDALSSLMADEGLSRYDWELLFVNDGSGDASLPSLLALRDGDDRVNVLSLSRNFGKENALLAGLDYAGGDAVIIMDADLQDPVGIVPAMVEAWEQGWDDVYGRRRDRGGESWARRRLSLAYYSMLQRLANIDVLPNVGDFRLLDRRCVDALRRLRETQRYSKGLFCWIGFNKKEIIFDRESRRQGRSSFSMRKLFNLAIEGITGYTTSPLRLSTIVGFVVSLIAFVYLAVILGKTLLWGEPVQGYPSLMCVILFLGGCQLIAIGIIGEYVGRIFNETKNRPAYIPDTYNGRKV